MASTPGVGAPRLWKDSGEEAECCVGPKRVARLMRATGLVGVSRRRGVRTTQLGPEKVPGSDLVRRDFTAIAANQLWVADITDVPTWAGFLQRVRGTRVNAR